MRAGMELVGFLNGPAWSASLLASGSLRFVTKQARAGGDNLSLGLLPV